MISFQVIELITCSAPSIASDIPPNDKFILNLEPKKPLYGLALVAFFQKVVRFRTAQVRRGGYGLHGENAITPIREEKSKKLPLVTAAIKS